MRPLQDYDIDPVMGFLPTEPPLRRLSDPYYEPWENMFEDFNGLLLAGKLRENIHKMPLLETNRLTNVREYRRAFLILCMLSHSYVWGKLEKTSETLPANLAVPWSAIASHLGLCPVVCHAAVVLWNYRLLDRNGPTDLSNLAALATYSGSLDEAWFYLVTTGIESAGARCVSAIVETIQDINDNNTEGILKHLTVIREGLEAMNDVLQRMYEKCDPYVFYWKIRPYLAGWENMAEAGLPFGLIYEGVDSLWSAETDEYADMSHLSEGERLLRQYRRYAGGSAAQSSLIAALDVAFGVEHYPTGEKPPMFKLNVNDRYTRLPTTNPVDELKGTPSSRSTPTTFVRTNRNAFLRAMRKYMPRPHREFLEDLEVASNMRSFVMHLDDNRADLDATEIAILDTYNDCLGLLKSFRDKHVQIVTLYIVNQARKGPNIAHGGFAIDKSKEKQPASESPVTATETKQPPHNVLYPQTALETSPGIRKGSVSDKVSHLFPELGLAKHVDPKTGVVRGTGGTNVLPFLKQSRDETADARLLPGESASTSSPASSRAAAGTTETATTTTTTRSWKDWFSSR
ncbi:Indoleamine 2,3-dioxygenase [Syncephalastrum racemosum]|uniref:Indoleamine 2,3-dioxygenase n=1 Tax=Syncephalastrum racemosum TaxID=13706 RepID=A0A1X2HDQ9_SYNRA|nr:Indoleamine 2,3-dioxygenase [Syncephalastrum racemosum]